VVELADPAQAETVARSFGSAETVGAGEWALHADGSLPVRLCFAGRRELGAVWLQATGDDEFLAGLEARAAGSGSVFSVVGSDEAEVLTALGLPWIPPELRRGRRWIEAAACGVLPRLVELGDLRGALHNHTTDSDGLATLEEMAGAAAGLGWSFFGVADHSPAAFYANGLDAERLRAQWSRADAWNDDHHDLRIVKGLEADILADGRLDIPEGCEAGLEVVVASVHSSFKMPAEVQTERLVTAVRNPACRILGHPTGRLLLARPAYEVDLERVLDACAEAGVAVEINASPYRLDLDATWARCALDRGLRLVVNPDAHSVDGLDDVRWGVTVARRAGATAIDVINCGDLETFL
jgi:DNA polymerase (family 10)